MSTITDNGSPDDSKSRYLAEIDQLLTELGVSTETIPEPALAAASEPSRVQQSYVLLDAAEYNRLVNWLHRLGHLLELSRNRQDAHTERMDRQEVRITAVEQKQTTQPSTLWHKLKGVFNKWNRKKQ